MKAAVIVTTYNRPDALAAVLTGFLEQTTLDFELLVADDGSRDETRQLVNDHASRAPFPLHHVWQPDQGFRAGAARNRAAAATLADYLVFVDGDCIPSLDFVARHCALAEAGHFLSGNRVLCSEAFTRTVLAHRVPIQRWSVARWMLAWGRRDINRVLPLIRLPDGRLRRRSPRLWQGVKTCNLSVWRKDFIHVNGFDERYAGWGLEDSDLVIRLLHAGIRHKSARFAAPVFHLWHPENDRSHLSENQKRLDEIRTSLNTTAVIGVSQYL